MTSRPCWGTWQRGETSEWCWRVFFFPSITVLPQAPGWRSVAWALSIHDGLVPSSLQPLVGQGWGRCGHSFLTVTMATMVALALLGVWQQCGQHHVPTQPWALCGLWGPPLAQPPPRLPDRLALGS